MHPAGRGGVQVVAGRGDARDDVAELGDDLGVRPGAGRREWLARWTAAAETTEPADAADPHPAEPAPVEPAPQEPEGAALVEFTAAPLPAIPASVVSEDRRGPGIRLFRPARGHAMVAGALAVIVAAVLGSLAAASPEPVPAQAGAASSDNASFEGDVTFPDGSVVAAGRQFTKVWQLRNTGFLRWEGRYLTRVNTTSCQAPDMVPIPVTEPGRSVRIKVPVTAADSAARCKIYWKMTDADRRLLLPDKNPIFLDVVVRSPADRRRSVCGEAAGPGCPGRPPRTAPPHSTLLCPSNVHRTFGRGPDADSSYPTRNDRSLHPDRGSRRGSAGAVGEAA